MIHDKPIKHEEEKIVAETELSNEQRALMEDSLKSAQERKLMEMRARASGK